MFGILKRHAPLSDDEVRRMDAWLTRRGMEASSAVYDVRRGKPFCREELGLGILGVVKDPRNGEHSCFCIEFRHSSESVGIITNARVAAHKQSIYSESKVQNISVFDLVLEDHRNSKLSDDELIRRREESREAIYEQSTAPFRMRPEAEMLVAANAIDGYDLGYLDREELLDLLLEELRPKLAWAIKEYDNGQITAMHLLDALRDAGGRLNLSDGL